MMFCPKCGSLLTQKRDGSKVFLGCSCGYVLKSGSLEVKEEVKSVSSEIEVVDSSEESLPETDADCEKCGNKVAYFWLVQTRAGDEPETKFLKCTKCNFTWRDYS